uniref:Putative secreted protein n=1 Tax=Ixodes ricinus TaxID=34613 RepID=V5GJ62_IXORI
MSYLLVSGAVIGLCVAAKFENENTICKTPPSNEKSWRYLLWMGILFQSRQIVEETKFKSNDFSGKTNQICDGRFKCVQNVAGTHLKTTTAT